MACDLTSVTMEDSVRYIKFHMLLNLPVGQIKMLMSHKCPSQRSILPLQNGQAWVRLRLFPGLPASQK